MLQFQTAPDRIFLGILTKSIEMMINIIIDLLEDVKDAEKEKEEVEWLLPNACNVFNAETALYTLESILINHKNQGIYHLNNYHYVLLYDTLETFYGIKNNLVNEAETMRDKMEISKIGSYYIEELDFDGTIETYFFDTDFLIDADTMWEMGLEGREQSNIGKETFALSQGLAPHPEELIIKAYKQEKAVIREPSVLFGPKSKIYPDYGYLEQSSYLT